MKDRWHLLLFPAKIYIRLNTTNKEQKSFYYTQFMSPRGTVTNKYILRQDSPFLSPPASHIYPSVRYWFCTGSTIKRLHTKSPNQVAFRLENRGRRFIGLLGEPRHPCFPSAESYIRRGGNHLPVLRQRRCGRARYQECVGSPHHDRQCPFLFLLGAISRQLSRKSPKDSSNATDCAAAPA